MRSQKKNNAACWECVFYATADGKRYCTASGVPVLIAVMPMKCEKREKEKG
jgi:hypothetical protein